MKPEWFDSGDSAFKNHPGDPQAAIRAILRRFKEWLAGIEPEERLLYCEHARYVGHNQALAFRCPGCKENLSDG